LSAAQPDLFDAPRLAGLSQADAIITPVEEQALIAGIDAVELSPFRFHGWVGKRLTASYGWRYDFDKANLARAEPLPDWLLPVRERAARFAGLRPDELVQALLIRYDPGAGIGWHRDRPQFGTVAGLSLTNPVRLRLRRRTNDGFERGAVELPPRSLYRLEGTVRWDWEHSIAPVEQTRRSITLRTLRGDL
jgi:alkylated DNA repair dioxygenase AlkB